MPDTTLELAVFGIDAGPTYLVWEWLEHGEARIETIVLERERVAELTELVDSAIPMRREGEDDDAMLTRVLTEGPFSSREAEFELARALAEALIPEVARAALLEAAGSGVRTLIRLLPPQSLAQVPWELLVVGDGSEASATRLIEVADLVFDVPGGIHVGRPVENVRPWIPDAQTTLYLVDPHTRVEGSVVGAGRQALEERLATSTLPAQLGADVTRRDLSRALREQQPNRFVFIGHVGHSSLGAGATAMILSDSELSYGRASSVARRVNGRLMRNRPLSAADLIEGTMGLPRYLPELERVEGLDAHSIVWPADDAAGMEVPGHALWPMPPRVAIIACDSGGDLRNPEPFGLATALINAGASVVTATKWTLPTDYALEKFGGVGGAHPLVDLALLVDDAHASPDPFAAIARLQRDRLTRWRSTGALVDSPILWAALLNYDGAPRAVEPLPPHEEAAA